jgi:hypothetical protein
VARARASWTALSSMNLLSHNSTVASENNATVRAEALAKENLVPPGFERRTHACQAGSQSLDHIGCFHIISGRSSDLLVHAYLFMSAAHTRVQHRSIFFF